MEPNQPPAPDPTPASGPDPIVPPAPAPEQSTAPEQSAYTPPPTPAPDPGAYTPPPTPVPDPGFVPPPTPPPVAGETVFGSTFVFPPKFAANAPQPVIPSNSDERLWATLLHLSGFIGSFVAVVGCVILPLVIWLIKKDASPFLNDQGKEVVNFQISMLIYSALLVVVSFIMGITVILACLIPVVAIAFAVYFLVLTIMGAIKANAGVAFRYPYTLRFLH